jgi:hypothetical protein
MNVIRVERSCSMPGIGTQIFHHRVTHPVAQVLLVDIRCNTRVGTQRIVFFIVYRDRQLIGYAGTVQPGGQRAFFFADRLRDSRSIGLLAYFGNAAQVVVFRIAVLIVQRLLRTLAYCQSA